MSASAPFASAPPMSTSAPSSYSVLRLRGQIALAGALMTEWKYENHMLNMHNTLWSYRGQLNFQSASTGSTGWHGSVEVLNDGAMELKFNAKGPDFPLRSTVVYAIETDTGEMTWKGSDYCCRQITLTRQRTFRLNESSRQWTVEH